MKTINAPIRGARRGGQAG